jgi:hypothetical protein
MRRISLVVAALLFAGAAQAQILWIGAGAGTTWSYEPDTAPNETFLHSGTTAPMVFAAVPLNDDTLLRLRAQTLPVDTLYNGEAWPGKVQAITLGVDYFLEDHLGEAVLSAGFGRYQLDLQAQQPPEGLEDAKFGWYVSVGQWFAITRRSRVTLDITVDRCTVPNDPILFSLNAALAFSF